MPMGKLLFAKIVATPTEDSWSQVYSAGNLYAVVALSKKDQKDDVILNVIGKGIINNLEAEFFTLETKDLDSIKSALKSALESTPEKVLVNLILLFVKESVAYVFLMGEGEILLERDKKRAAIITSSTAKKSPERDVLAGSGPLKDNDLLLLKTKEFDEIISKEALDEAFDTGSAEEAAEILSPMVHGKEKGSASAMFLTYSSEQVATSLEEAEDEQIFAIKNPDTNKEDEIPTQEKQVGVNLDQDQPEIAKQPEAKDFFTEPQLPQDEKEKKPFKLPLPHIKLPEAKKKYLIITAVILLVLVGSILFTNSQKENAKTKEEFQKVYAEAQKEIEEGEGLEDLNAEVAEDNFKNAKKLLDDNKDKFKEGTEERQKIDELLEKVNKKTTGESNSTSIATKEVEASLSPLLALQIAKKALFVTQNEDNILFYLTQDAIFKMDKDEEEEIIKNDDDWASVTGLGAFGTNLYVLDKKEGLMKFVAGSNGYGKSNYFVKDTNPTLSNAKDMAIDASIYILYADGKVEKYTRGEKDDFTISGLKKPLKSPGKLFTGEEVDNIYILDNGNSRIVQIDKNGNYKKEFNAQILKNATNLTVSETDSKAYVLIKDKVYELSTN